MEQKTIYKKILIYNRWINIEEIVRSEKIVNLFYNYSIDNDLFEEHIEKKDVSDTAEITRSKNENVISINIKLDLEESIYT